MLVLLDVRKNSGDTWPVGSVRMDLEMHLSTPGDPADGGRHPLPDCSQWCERLGDVGVTPESHVVVFDDADGGLAAARCWWMLRAVGHRRCWVVPLGQLGVPLTDVPTELRPCGTYPAGPDWSWPTADADQVESARLDPTWRVIDARDAVRFRGEHEPLDPIAGHIPGAANLPWRDVTSLEVFQRRWDALVGDAPPERTIVHCGSGVMACHLLLQHDRLGRRPARLYVGSWSESSHGDALRRLEKALAPELMEGGIGRGLGRQGRRRSAAKPRLRGGVMEWCRQDRPQSAPLPHPHSG